ncbi:MAG: hypothetical protein RBU45_02160 [Myxococcota bacterium]|jgi:hypothetical protein|nr:hypothetical protein [Myxococcota bacterium]
MSPLFERQVDKLREGHFLVLYWVARAEDTGHAYNITNAFDDLKAQGITRTKQTAVAMIEALDALDFLRLQGQGNRKHLLITEDGARALERLVHKGAFQPRRSSFLEAQS